MTIRCMRNGCILSAVLNGLIALVVWWVWRMT